MPKSVFWTTIENQVRPDGSRGLLYDHYDNEEDAEAKFYTICASAAKSDIPYHSAHLLRSDGIIIEGKVFDRRADVTPEPTEE